MRIICLLALLIVVAASCTTIHIPLPQNVPPIAPPPNVRKEKSEKEIYGHIIHEKGMRRDTCDMKLMLRLLDKSMTALNGTKPLADTRLDSARIAIQRAYVDYNSQRNIAGADNRFMIDESEMEKRLMQFIDLIFNPEDTRRNFFSEDFKKIFDFFRYR